ncbi:sarcosine oxidase subunit gamma [Frigidibacter sp. RF13]|uniref:sarcosine oxidase subunit gamma n=1 Tax=Frigidibacter sp. RF13 TaxID=2997340 RepID=UPI00226D4393|nr:sarcosine oxidase subunit gamma [Frigidibacter sp. RF13]MCY1127268.1 sarcosine oxidase subunit gamma [Frigidibacter sp. RF13]
MAKLIAKPAAGELLPVTIGSLTLSDMPQERITAIAPYPGKIEAVSNALERLGLAFPAPGASQQAAKARILWAGRDLAFLIGAAPPAGLGPIAAQTDQSDGWAGLALSGPGVEAALARLVPLDLSLAAFPEGATARTALGHITILLHRTGAENFALYLFRSMIATAIHELETVMRALLARASL